jgi:hypothetical protein
MLQSEVGIVRYSGRRSNTHVYFTTSTKFQPKRVTDCNRTWSYFTVTRVSIAGSPLILFVLMQFLFIFAHRHQIFPFVLFRSALWVNKSINHSVQSILWVPVDHNLHSVGYQGFGGIYGRVVKLTTHLQLVQRSRKHGSIHPLPHTPSWRRA